MAEKIKKFFARKKADAKFKLAGPGRTLTEQSSSASSEPKSRNVAYQPHPSVPSVAKENAAQAALERLNKQKHSSAFNTSFGAIQAQVRRELEAEKRNVATGGATSNPRSIDNELNSQYLVVQGVYFRCPLISEEVLSKEEWRAKIKEFLFAQLEEEPGLTACLIIHSCNHNRTKINECIDVLIRYLDNIIGNPDEQKFHKIRCSNATFSDKVEPILGSSEFLHAAGFHRQHLENNGATEEFLVFNPENVDSMDTLQFLRDAVKSEDRIDLELDRNLQVLSPAQASKRVDLPADFYNLSAEEIKREQSTRTEQMEKQLQLRTKAMREREEQREFKKYKFAVIRIRFPDGLYLQGTFSVYEKFSAVVQFVQENLENEGLPFVLNAPTGHCLEESDFGSTLIQLKLVPAVILTFQWDPSIAEQVAAAGNCQYLKSEIILLMKQL